MATSSRIQPPSVNLKERIAALQQRSISVDTRPSSPTPLTPSPTSTGLRDKIAKFERRGKVPAPRGSLGLGAPPILDNGSQKRRRELYGNRIPPGVRASYGSGSLSRSGSPLDSPRYFSVSILDGEDSEVPESPPYLPSSFTSPPSSPPLSESPTAATDVTQPSGAMFHNEAGGGGITVLSPIFASPVSQTSQYEAEDDQLEAVATPSIVISSSDALHSTEAALIMEEAKTSPSPPAPLPDSVIPSPAGELEKQETLTHVEVPQPSGVLYDTSSVPPIPPSSTVTEDRAAELIPDIPKPDLTDPVPNSLTKGPIMDTPDTIKPDTITSLPKEAVIMEPPSLPLNHHVDSTTISLAEVPVKKGRTKPSVVAPPSPAATVSADKSTSRVEQPVIIPEIKANADLTSPVSPIGPHTLASVVASLGQMVSDIHDLFPDQLSPLTSPPLYRPMKLEPTPDDTSRERKKSTSSKEAKKPMDLTIHLDEPNVALKAAQPSGSNATTSRPEIPAPAADDMLKPTPHSTPHPTENAQPTGSPLSAFLSTPHSPRGRPMSMIETSPGQVAFGQRMTPFTGRTVYIPPQGQQQQRDLSHFPPTPGPQESDLQFGTVSMGHAKTHSRAPSFSAVVHRKITELPPSSSMTGSLDMPVTPGKRHSSSVRDGLVSPGQGELASLLQSAALLEETLWKGELPSEVPSDEGSKKQEKEEQERAEALAKAKAEEGRKKEAAVKKRVSAQPQKRTKRSFRTLTGQPILQRDPSVSSSDGQPINSKDLADRLPFRPQPSRRSTEGSGRPSEASSRQTLHASSLEIHAEPSTRDADAGSHTSPKSPLHYFANLRRFASSTRSLTGSNNTQPRLSASTSSEMSSDDSAPLATPPDNGLDPSTSGSSTKSGQASGVPWPSLSPKKSGGGVGRAAAFAEKIWRGRSRSTVSTTSAYDTIDRLTKSASAKAAAASIPHLDPIGFSLEIPGIEDGDILLPSPQPELASPRRSKSFQSTSVPQFPPIYTPVPTSPVYTPHKQPSTVRSVLRPEDAMQPLHIDSVFLAGKSSGGTTSPGSEGISEESSNSSILSPLFDSFPCVPTVTSPSLPESPLLSQGNGHKRPPIITRPSLPLATPSFFDAAPSSSAVVGAEFLPGMSPAFARSATLPPMSFEWQR